MRVYLDRFGAGGPGIKAFWPSGSKMSWNSSLGRALSYPQGTWKSKSPYAQGRPKRVRFTFPGFSVDQLRGHFSHKSWCVSVDLLILQHLPGNQGGRMRELIQCQGLMQYRKGFGELLGTNQNPLPWRIVCLLVQMVDTPSVPGRNCTTWCLVTDMTATPVILDGQEKRKPIKRTYWGTTGEYNNSMFFMEVGIEFGLSFF